jgi:hypothetical protein
MAHRDVVFVHKEEHPTAKDSTASTTLADAVIRLATIVLGGVSPYDCELLGCATVSLLDIHRAAIGEQPLIAE